MKRCVLVLVSLSVVLAFGEGRIVQEHVPDRISMSGVVIDFTQPKNPISIEEGASISDVASAASWIAAKYVRPSVETGTVSERDFFLLNFCLDVFDAQAAKLRRLAEREMGLAGNDVDEPLPDVEIKGRGSEYSSKGVRERISKCAEKSALEEFKAYCREYNYKDHGGVLADYNGIRNALEKERELMDKGKTHCIQNLSIDLEVYKARADIKSLEWNLSARKLWGQVALGSVVGGVGIAGCTCVASMAIAGFKAGSLAGAGAGAAAGGVGAVPGVVIGGAAGVAVGAGAGIWMYYNTRSQGSLKVVELTDGKVKELLGSIDDRFGYLKTITSSDGLYQKTYMDLVRMCELVENWKKCGWESSFKMTEDCKDKLERWCGKMRERSKNTLTLLEDAVVNYPLMCNLVEGTSVCLYLNVLDAERQKAKAKEINDLRRKWLANCPKFADLCSEYCTYSTAPMARNEAGKYNFYLKRSYATNRVETIALKSEKEVQDYWKNHSPLFKSDEAGYVERGCVRAEDAMEYKRLVDAFRVLKTNKLLQELAVYSLGDDLKKNETVMKDWVSEVDNLISQRWLYPSWSKEARTPPPRSEEIVNTIELCCSTNRVGEQINLVLKAACLCKPELKPMMNVFGKKSFKSATDRNEVCKRLITYISWKKLSKETKAKIEKGFGSNEGFVEKSLDCLMLKKDVKSSGEGAAERPESALPKDLSGVAEKLRADYLPLWKEIAEAKEPWWKFW